MINFAFQFFLTLNATSLLLIVFMVQKTYSLGFLFPDVEFLQKIPNFLSYVIYALIPMALTGISIWFCQFLGKDQFQKNEIESIEYAHNSFLPSYLGYFFVALSITNWGVFSFVYGMLFLFTFFSQAMYFNPLFLIFGYKFYNVRTRGGVGIFLISRKKLKRPAEIEIPMAFRINNYTFIDRG